MAITELCKYRVLAG